MIDALRLAMIEARTRLARLDGVRSAYDVQVSSKIRYCARYGYHVTLPISYSSL